MKCVICHGEDVQLKDVAEELKINSDVVMIPVRVLVCQSCGERYYSRQAMQILEKAEIELKGGTAKLREIGKVLTYQ